jgi:hypothetical protein
MDRRTTGKSSYPQRKSRFEKRFDAVDLCKCIMLMFGGGIVSQASKTDGRKVVRKTVSWHIGRIVKIV